MPVQATSSGIATRIQVPSGDPPKSPTYLLRTRDQAAPMPYAAPALTHALCNY